MRVSGKTALLGSWAASAGAPGSVAWLSLDSGDGDRRSFWRAVLQALSRADGGEAVTALAAHPPPRIERLVSGLTAVLPGWPASAGSTCSSAASAGALEPLIDRLPVEWAESDPEWEGELESALVVLEAARAVLSPWSAELEQRRSPASVQGWVVDALALDVLADHAGAAGALDGANGSDLPQARRADRREAVRRARGLELLAP